MPAAFALGFKQSSYTSIPLVVSILLVDEKMGHDQKVKMTAKRKSGYQRTHECAIISAS